MLEKDKQLLLKDICERIPYGVKCTTKAHGWPGVYSICGCISNKIILDCPKEVEGDDIWLVQNIVPYLRPMSSMTEDEERELSKKYVWDINCGQIEIRYHSDGYWDDNIECPTSEYLNLFDWFSTHHFDYRGLIPMGLALEAPEGMYDTKTEQS